MPLCGSLPQWRVKSWSQQDFEKMVELPRPDDNDTVTSVFTSLDHTLWKCGCRVIRSLKKPSRKVRVMRNWGLPPTARTNSLPTIPAVDSPVPIKSEEACRSGHCLHCRLWNPEPKPPAVRATPEFRMHRYYETMNVCCDLKPLRFVAIFLCNNSLYPWSHPRWHDSSKLRALSRAITGMPGIPGKSTPSSSPLIHSTKKKFHNREAFLLKSLRNGPTVSNRIGFKWTFLYFSTCQGSCEA